MNWGYLLVVFLIIVVGVAIVTARQRFVAVTVYGNSMRPTFRSGDRVLVRRVRMAAVRRGHVVVVEQPDVSGSVRRLWAIKRVAAVPGEPVPPGLEPALSHLAGEPVPGGHLVLLGDNREASRDSRRYGFIPGELLLGVVVRRLGG